MSTLTETVRGIGSTKIAAIAIVALLMVGSMMILTLRMSTSNLVPIYTGLDLQDSAKIVAELEKTGTPYELAANGTQVNVPADRVLRLRMSMAEAGLPSGGSIVGYEIFDRSDSFGSSNFVMSVNMMRALEGELARTIGSLTDVDSARVHLVMPKQELFSRDRNQPSASVTIKMRGGKALEKGEVIAVTHLVASAVPGLSSSRVTVVDGHGRLMARGDGEDGLGTGASTAAEYRIAYENRIQNTLEDMLENVIGLGKVRIQVAADINLDRVVINTEKYDPEGQVARSTQSTSERSNAQDKAGGGDVSVANNLPGGAAGSSGGAGSSQDNERTDETVNFEISKTVQNHIKEGGNLNKISVAVLVDGTYSADADGNEVYTPRSDEEMKKIKTLVSSAIGFDEKRGDTIEIVNMRFTQDALKAPDQSFFERFKLEMQSIIQTLIIAVVALLAIMLVLRPAVVQLIKQTQAPSDRVSSELAALEMPGGGMLPGVGGGSAPSFGGASMDSGGSSEAESLIDVANIKGGMKSSSMKKVIEIVDKYPEETMGVLRQWSSKQSA